MYEYGIQAHWTQVCKLIDLMERLEKESNKKYDQLSHTREQSAMKDRLLNEMEDFDSGVPFSSCMGVLTMLVCVGFKYVLSAMGYVLNAVGCV